MASYHQQSRRHGSHYPRSRDSDGYSSLNSNVYPLDPRYAAAPPPLPLRNPAYPPPPPPRSETRKKRAWPPSPSVEDEGRSLAREVSPRTSLSDVSTSGEVPSRGTVDQEPIMLDVEQPNISDNDERRFVWFSESGSSVTSSSPTTGDTPREGRRRSFAERANIPHLKTDVNNDPPIFTKREPSPYAYSKPARESTAPDYFLSPEPITPSARHKSGPRDQNEKPEKSHARYDSVQHRVSKNDAFEDSDLDSDDAVTLRTERKPARYSFVKGDLQREDPRTSLHGTSTEPPARPRPLSRSSGQKPPNEGSHSASSSLSYTLTPPSLRSSTSSIDGAGTIPRQIPVPRSSQSNAPKNGGPKKYPDSRPSSPYRPSSPVTRDRPPPSSPPRSPKLAQERSVPSTTSDRRPPSRNGTRPPSPSPLSYSSTLPPPSPVVPVTAADWHATYPPVVENRTRHPRFNRYDSAPTHVPRVDVQSPSPARPVIPQQPLPYPVDERPVGLFMPTEENFQYAPPSPAVPQSPNFRQPYPESPRIPIPSSPSVDSPRDRPASTRPLLSSRYTDDIPRSTRPRSASIRSQTSYDGRQKDKKPTTEYGVNKPLPPCPRTRPLRKYDDWYTLENCPNFDVCPNCFEAVFKDTQFSEYFSQSRRYERPILRSCDFSSPWVRIAWLLMARENRNSLDVLYRLATIVEISEPCPDSEPIMGKWYGITDRDGIHVKSFTVCSCDVKQLEVLLPSLKGSFTRIPSSMTPNQAKCSLRTTSARFTKYLDLLVEIDAEARKRRRSPDLKPFVTLAQENAWKMECPRDKALAGQPWHFIPALPEFTVCEECYDEVIYPDIKAGSRLAKDFNRTLQMVPGERDWREPDNQSGTSCCLYSPRMRRVWRRAVEDDDYDYLERKAVERKKVEGMLGRDIKRYTDLLDGNGPYRLDSEEKERYREQLRKLEKVWEDWE